MTKRFLFFLISCYCTITCIGQDIHLSQFFNTPLLRNPAMAGLFTGDLRVQTVYRNQWQSIGFPYQTNAFNCEYKFSVGDNDDYMTIGGSFFYDQAGLMKLKTLQVMPSLTFHKSLSNTRSQYLSGGFMAGFVTRRFDGKNLTFDNQYTGGVFNQDNSSGESFIGLNRGFADMAAGLSFNSSIGERGSMYVGSSLWHFNKPTYSFMSDNMQLDPKLQFNAGLRGWLNEQVQITLEGNYLNQGNYEETVAGAMIKYYFEYAGTDNSSIKEIGVGGGLLTRLNDAIIPYLQLSYNKFDLGVSYDINISSLKVGSQGRGGFEFSMSYKAFTSNSRNEVKYMRCPKF